MLKTVALGSGGGYTYWYGADGERFEKWANGTAVKGYAYGNGSDPLIETDGSGNVTSQYVYLNGRRVARVDSAGIHYYLEDHLKSTSMVVTASTGAIEQESDYHPYGAEVVVIQGPSPYKFTSKERDTETSNDYFGARMHMARGGGCRRIGRQQPSRFRTRNSATRRA